MCIDSHTCFASEFCGFVRHTNWGLRREVQSFLDEHAEYLPQGWEEPRAGQHRYGAVGNVPFPGVEQFAVEKKTMSKTKWSNRLFFLLGIILKLTISGIKVVEPPNRKYTVFTSKPAAKIQHSFLQVASFIHHLLRMIWKGFGYDWIWESPSKRRCTTQNPPLEMHNLRCHENPSHSRIVPYQPPHRWRSCQHRNAAEQDDARLRGWFKTETLKHVSWRH